MATNAAARPRVVAGLRLVAPVGEGGEGEVWEARDGRGRRRALKLIRPDALVPPAEVERRGRWLLAIDHPALVAVHRCGVLAGAGLDGWGFVEMAFVDGPSLVDAPPDADALDRLGPLAEALDLLHAGRWSDGVPLVHRDVKPANLIEREDGGLVLVDASTLREVDDGTRTRIGTPLFAAPEVVTGRAGPLADVYSFAATAVALLTGARRSALADLLEAPASLDVPASLRAALSIDPAARPVSCRAALDPSLPLVVGAEVGWGPPRRPQSAEAAWDPSAGAPPEEGRHHGAVPHPGDAPAAASSAGRAGPAGWGQAAGWERGAGWEGAAHPEGAAGGGGAAGAVERPDAPAAEPAWGPVSAGSLVPAAEVLLDPWTDPYAPPRAPAPVGWLVLLAALPAYPLWLAFQAAAMPDRVGGLVGAGVAAGVAAASAGRPVLQSFVLPPVAWASLLAERTAGREPVRGWTRAAALAATASLAALSVGAVLRPQVVDPVVALWLAPAVWAVAALAVVAGRGSRLLRVALAPAWAVGAAALTAGAVGLLPFAFVVGRARPLGALLRATLGGAAAFLRRG